MVLKGYTESVFVGILKHADRNKLHE